MTFSIQTRLAEERQIQTSLRRRAPGSRVPASRCGGSAVGRVDVLVEDALAQTRVGDTWRGVRRGVDVVRHVRARLEAVEPIRIVARAGLTRVPGTRSRESVHAATTLPSTAEM